jgi:hypothetical protein
MENFIYEKQKSLTDEFCDYIIDIYEKTPNMKKKDNEFSVNLNSNKNEEHNKLKNIIISEIYGNIKSYYENIGCEDIINNFNNIQNKISIQYIILKKYCKGEKTESYDNNVRTDYNNMKYSILKFIWYLNDVQEGGETIFSKKYKIIPEKGKMIMFPSEWFFPYEETECNSDDKYVITGYIYLDI